MSVFTTDRLANRLEDYVAMPDAPWQLRDFSEFEKDRWLWLVEAGVTGERMDTYPHLSRIDAVAEGLAWAGDAAFVRGFKSALLNGGHATHGPFTVRIRHLTLRQALAGGK